VFTSSELYDVSTGAYPSYFFPDELGVLKKNNLFFASTELSLDYG
jgi:hypothetical protein